MLTEHLPLYQVILLSPGMSLLTAMCARSLSTLMISQSLLLAIIPVELPTMAPTLHVLVFIRDVKTTEKVSEPAIDALNTATCSQSW